MRTILFTLILFCFTGCIPEGAVKVEKEAIKTDVKAESNIGNNPKILEGASADIGNDEQIGRDRIQTDITTKTNTKTNIKDSSTSGDGNINIGLPIESNLQWIIIIFLFFLVTLGQWIIIILLVIFLFRSKPIGKE